MDKKIKSEFKKKASLQPDKYYATEFLKKQGYFRYKCEKCGTFFWSTSTRSVCGDPSCTEGFDFFEDNPCKNKLSYIQTWNEFKDHMEETGYSTIKRYPVVARWRDDTDFVQASIYNFQPFVVSGQVDPPANPLIVPQFCLRFNDIDNVGVTMSHFTGFIMIGQHTFVGKEEWNQTKYFSDLFNFFTYKLGIDKSELIMHEDAWAGGGNHGPCMEIFSRGMELANQVYMLYEHDESGTRDLKLKVLDMGMGHERVAWFTQGKKSAYDAVMPDVMNKIYERTGFKVDEKFFSNYVKFAPFLNIDEVEDIDEAWKTVSLKTNMSLDKIKEILPKMSAIYSIAEHIRSLTIAISDGALPSNVKGGYNLRVILRRSLSLIDKFKFNLDITEIAKWHCVELYDLFPELDKNYEHIKKILEVEISKYKENKIKTNSLIKKLASKKDIEISKLLELYDSHGVDPFDVKEEFNKQGKKLTIPDNFYNLVSQRHENSDRKELKTNKTNIRGFEETIDTNILYYEHYDLLDFKATVMKINEDYVALNQTAFYPTSGGQEHDVGEINGCKVLDVIKQGTIVLHKVKDINFKQGDTVFGKVDYDRREQLSQHHTATHILTGSVRKLLGSHVWQAGAAKTLEKGRLDITHFENLSANQIKSIEQLSKDIIKSNVPVYKEFMSRSKAESLYGIRIYQGGAVPGKTLRIVSILDFDVEACGGTHVDVTGDVFDIKIIKTSKIQDGVVRLEFVAGRAFKKLFDKEKEIIDDACKILSCQKDLVASRSKQLFKLWKLAKKNKLTKFEFSDDKVSKEDVIKETAENLKTQPEHIVKTLKRFKSDIDKKLAK